MSHPWNSQESFTYQIIVLCGFPTWKMSPSSPRLLVWNDGWRGSFSKFLCWALSASGLSSCYFSNIKCKVLNLHQLSHLFKVYETDILLIGSTHKPDYFIHSKVRIQFPGPKINTSTEIHFELNKILLLRTFIHLLANITQQNEIWIPLPPVFSGYFWVRVS